MRKSAFCICENKDADQRRGNREADQRLCFRYTDITIHLLSKYEISSLLTSSVPVQPGLCQTWSETPKTGFLTTRLNYHRGTYSYLIRKHPVPACKRTVKSCRKHVYAIYCMDGFVKITIFR